MATVTVTDDMVQKALADVDWDAIDAMTDEDIARQIVENPDAAPDTTDPLWRLRARVNSDRLKPRQKVRMVRRVLGMSQAQFAQAYHIPLRTLQGWEQGTREPDEASSNLIKLIAYQPDQVRRILNDGADSTATSADGRP
ncbi:helix-turn-helix domain-containing protein [Azospirillum sp. sgz302134]